LKEKRPPANDVAWLLNETLDDTVSALTDYMSKDGFGLSYARSFYEYAPKVVSGLISERMLATGTGEAKSIWKPVRDALLMLLKAQKGVYRQTHPLSEKTFWLDHEISTKIRIVGFQDDDFGTRALISADPRKTLPYNHLNRRFFVSMYHYHFAQEGLYTECFKHYELGAENGIGVRKFKLFTEKDFSIMSIDEFQANAQRYLKAYEIVRAMGLTIAKPVPHKTDIHTIDMFPESDNDDT